MLMKKLLTILECYEQARIGPRKARRAALKNGPGVKVWTENKHNPNKLVENKTKCIKYL